MNDLLPCPFCGSTKIESLVNLDFVACQDCGASLEDVEPSARDLWNRRAPSIASAQQPSNQESGAAALADEIDRAMTEFADTIGELKWSTRRINAVRALRGVLWDNKAGIVAYLRMAPARSVSEGDRGGVLETLNTIAPAVENLARHQEQCDMDGVMVKVSRQALDEVLNAINGLALDLSQLPSTDRGSAA